MAQHLRLVTEAEEPDDIVQTDELKYDRRLLYVRLILVLLYGLIFSVIGFSIYIFFVCFWS